MLVNLLQLRSAEVLRFSEVFLYLSEQIFLRIPPGFNTLTANYEYSRGNRENLQLPIQMQLSEKAKTFCFVFLNFVNFVTFFESTLNFELFFFKTSLIAQVFLKLMTPKDVLT